MFRRIGVVLGASILLSGFGVTAASAATSSAPVTSFTSASTTLTNRPDSGDNGTDWALDHITRNLSIQLLGGHPGHWFFTAVVTDLGNFQTINDAYTPNQNFPWHNDRIAMVLDGRMSGYDYYAFTASTLPSKALVPSTENGAPVKPDQGTSLWFEQAFPAGTSFSGGETGTWGWSYTAPGCGPAGTQTWLDSSAAEAGNITGFCF